MSGHPRICVSLGATTAKMLQRQLKRVEDTSADLVEFRVDFLEHPSSSQVKECLNSSDLPKILTCRSSEEGGKFHGSTGARLRLLRELAVLGPEYLDVELATLESNEQLTEDLQDTGCKLIASSHPADGLGSLSNLQKTARYSTGLAHVGKVIPRAESIEDNLRILTLYKNHQEGKLVAFCLGKLGFLSRALCPLFGSPFTYAGLIEDATAEGQPSIVRLRRFYEEMNA